MSTPLRPTLRFLACVLLSNLILCGSPILADGDVVQGDPTPDARGSWAIPDDDGGERNPDGTPLRAAAAMAGLKGLVRSLEGTKGWAPPRGVRIEARIAPVDTGRKDAAALLPAARLDLHLIALVRNETGIVPGYGRERTLSIVANDLDAAIGRENRMEEGYADEAGRSFYREPEVLNLIQGFRRHRQGQLVIARPGRDPWVAVSRGEFLKATIRRAESQIAENAAGRQDMAAFRPSEAFEAQAAERRKSFQETYATLKAFSPDQAEEFKRNFEKMEKELPAQFKAQEAQLKDALAKDPMGDALRRRIEALRKELAAMPPAEASAQAWWAGEPESFEASGLVPTKSDEARPLVRPNPAYFDSGPSASPLQILVVESGLPTDEEELAALEESGAEDDFVTFKCLRLLGDVDWKALAKRLER